ncbi:hypothetical protein LCGC14_2844970, partial [marine sediment metagenome]
KYQVIRRDGSLIVVDANDPVFTSSAINLLFGIERVAIAKQVKNEFKTVVASITKLGSNLLLKGDKFYVKVEGQSKGYLPKDVEFAATSSLIEKTTKLGAKPGTEDKPDKLVTLTEKKFLRTLGKQKTLQYHQEIVPYLENPTPERYDFFDNSITEAYIFNRILELGWSPSLHYEFDKNKDMHYTLHDSHRPEKLSEKYQWIALYEFLAYLCDHYEYGNQYSDDDNKYEGPWQGLYRDIDPSYLNENSPKNVMGDCLSLPIINIDWEQYATNKCWVSQEGDMPDFKGILQVNGCGERKWLLLDGYYNFMEPHPPEEEPYEKYRKNMWFMIHSYFVRKSDTDTLFAWLKKQNFMDLRMPERGSGYGDIFLGEYFWSPAFNYYNRPYYGRNDWIKSEDHFH